MSTPAAHPRCVLELYDVQFKKSLYFRSLPHRQQEVCGTDFLNATHPSRAHRRRVDNLEVDFGHFHLRIPAGVGSASPRLSCGGWLACRLVWRVGFFSVVGGGSTSRARVPRPRAPPPRRRFPRPGPLRRWLRVPARGRRRSGLRPVRGPWVLPVAASRGAAPSAPPSVRGGFRGPPCPPGRAAAGACGGRPVLGAARPARVPRPARRSVPTAI